MRRIIGRVPRAGLLCALVAFLAGTAWSLVTPPFEVPDETAHFPYVQALAETGNPPDVQGGPAYSDEVARTLEAIKFDAVVGRPGDRGVWSDREQARLAAIQGQTLRRDNGTGYSNASSQPPGYYALGAVVYWASPSQDVLTRLWLLRMLGALLAAGTTLAAFLFLREVLPGTPLAWTTGGLAVALQPVFGFTSAGVNSDALLFLASALMFLAVARAFRRGLDVRSGAFIGAATALGIMTKLNFLAFVPGVSLALLVLLWRARRGTAGDGGRIALRGTLAAAAIVAVPALVYIGLNTLVWHRSWWAQSLQAQVTETSNGNGSVSGIPIRQQLGYVWQLYLPRLPFMLDQFPYFPPYETWWKRTFGVFGWVDYGFRPWVYQVGLALFAVVCAAAAAGLVRARAVLTHRKAELVVLAVLVAGLLVELGLFGIRYRADTGFEFEQGRYLMPLLPVYALVPALAVRGVGARAAPVAAAIIVTLVGAHELFALLLSISRFYG